MTSNAQSRAEHALLVHDKLLAELVRVHEQFHTIHVRAARATSKALLHKHKTAERLGTLLGVGLHQVGQWVVQIDHDADGRWVVDVTDNTEVSMNKGAMS